ncbi:MAG TPA: ABC transporter permease [Thermodesulfobacteriota bacterium]|nr:ABC transporter permease [Thermodesulfobacteriota bacterium]
MKGIKNIYNLGKKEFLSLRNDKVLIFLIIYGFTFVIYSSAQDDNMELRNASIAIVDEDRSQLSSRIYDAFPEPFFLTPESLDINKIDSAMDSGKFTFIVDIPDGFESDVISGRSPIIQVNVDATAMSQAGNGSGYISRILADEVTEYLKGYKYSAAQPAGVVIRIKFNPNLTGSWFMSIMEMINVATMLAILFTGAAIIREREHGTIDHLLVMPLTPLEIMTAKFWANGLVIVLAMLFSLTFVVTLALQVHIQGSVPLFIAGTALYLFSMTSIGIFIATISRSMPQLGLLCILVIFPMLTLSGGYTPLDSMPKIIEIITTLSPTRHFVSYAQAVLFRDAGLLIVWKEFVIVAVIGLAFFIGSLMRFRKTITMAQ